MSYVVLYPISATFAANVQKYLDAVTQVAEGWGHTVRLRHEVDDTSDNFLLLIEAPAEAAPWLPKVPADLVGDVATHAEALAHTGEVYLLAPLDGGWNGYSWKPIAQEDIGEDDDDLFFLVEAD